MDFWRSPGRTSITSRRTAVSTTSAGATRPFKASTPRSSSRSTTYICLYQALARPAGSSLYMPPKLTRRPTAHRAFALPALKGGLGARTVRV
jgi:hypothetical protein